MLFVFLTLSILLLIFQYKPVQTWAAKKATAYLSGQLHTTIGIKSIYLKPFTSVVLQDFYVLDKQKDTILNTPQLTVGISGFSLFKSIKRRTLDLSLVQLNNSSVYLKTYKDSTTNLDFIINYFNTPDTSKSEPWTVDFDKVVLKNMHFRYKNYEVDTLVKGVNFNDVDVTNLSTVVYHMDVINHLFKGNVRNLTLREKKSGFYIKNLSANATVDTDQILATHLLLVTPHSLIKNYFRMRFKSFSDFNDIEDKVYMDGNFIASRVSSYDISYFTDGLDHVKFDLGINGRINGLVNNLSSKDLLITGGQSTYVRGNFHLTGLPHWDNTYLDLDFDQIATNKKDLDLLYNNFTGQHDAHLPDMISKFGNINFNGKFAGMQDNFVASGTFKTKLGRIDPNISLKISKAGVPSYSGKISATNFDLGSLLGVSSLGRTTLTANIKGSGDVLKNLDAAVDARISYLGFNSYNYTNLAVNGTFIKKLASGKLSINDKNIKLDLNGSVNLNPALPVYNVTANIDGARLHTLNLMQDTITLSTGLSTNFKGDDLANLQGNVLFTPIRLADPRNHFLLDSIYLSLSRDSGAKQVLLRSDLADGSIKGNFDLATLPGYFKTIVKKYAPSLNKTNATSKPQDFTFNLSLKDLSPFTDIFVPQLKVPDQGTFAGQFNSVNKTAVLNGYVKTIQYGKTVFHDFIIDESTNNDQLGVNISLSRINITDSLFIKNIDISNVIRRDSMNFNLKLADKDAANQLDLYGLVQFGTDTIARLQLLPSDVILEHEDWKLPENVRIRFLKGKTQISGLQLTNGQQKVRVNGYISDNPDDQLKLSFEKFGMDNFDQLTKLSDIALKGTLNGNVTLTTLTKIPGIDSHLTIDSLTMNKTLVGNVSIASALANNGNDANINMNVNNNGIETMNIAGTLSLAKEDRANALDFNVKMDHAETIIFEPFINDIVTNPKGSISSDLKMTGPIDAPMLNGDVTLANIGVTVNYLKTAYTVDDKLTVTNSIINIDNMVIKDNHGGEGIVNGKVDLNNLANPDIEAVVTAKNLMVLNTTFKDNHLYYGTAYGTGRFSFNGPVNNMNIDIKARTMAGTVFNIPLNTSSTAGDYDFIKFVSHKDTVKQVKTSSFNGVTLNMDLTIDEKTIVKITTDYGKLEGSGTANNLKLIISSEGDFEMFGDFLISSGKFEFTAKNFISKNFVVNQGGTIRWTGNPANAEINLKAIYEVRTDIAPLYTAAGQQSPKGSEQVLVQAELIITKSLLQPSIDFDFNFPTDPSIKDDLGTYLTDYNNRSQQALSIIVRRNFAPGTGNNLTNQVLGTAGDAVSEFAFNKLNTFISQSNIKNFDLTLRSFNDASATFKLLNERLVLNGSLFSNTASSDLFNNSSTNLLNSNFNDLTKDFEAQYLIRKDGDLTATYSYRVLNSTTLNLIDQLSVQYVNGVGLIYQRDFDTIGEFFKNFFGKGKRKSQSSATTSDTSGLTDKADGDDQ